MIHPCDRQTDGRAIAYTRYSIYAVARKNVLSSMGRIYILTGVVGVTAVCSLYSTTKQHST